MGFTTGAAIVSGTWKKHTVELTSVPGERWLSVPSEHMHRVSREMTAVMVTIGRAETGMLATAKYPKNAKEFCPRTRELC